ncbi:MAG: HutD family protein, partial [Halioglobus sp.]|nr:HutD family protein [Halioglobus sp.]
MLKKIIKRSEYRQMPWANGGGLTDELCIHYDEETGHMLWRISMADVALDGPFSCFEGYDRVLVLINGRGLTLNFNSGTTVGLHEPYDQVSFAGDIGTHAILLDGPIQDFNVIVRRNALKAEVTILRDACILSLLPNAETLAILALDNDLTIVEPCTESNSV